MPANTSVDVPASALTPPPTAIEAAVRCSAFYATFAANNLPTDIYCDTPAPLFIGDVADADQLQVRLSPNALAGGGDFPGSELEVMRGSLLLDWSLGAGTITSRTGYTDADTRIFNDRDKFAIQATPGDGIDLSPIVQILDTDTSTEQISQELSFTSAFDGPVQFTIGGLYWNEDVDQKDQNHFATASGAIVVFPCVIPGPPVVTFPCDGVTSTPVAPLIASLPGVHAAKPIGTTKRETDHWSAFGALNWDLAADVRLNLDLRYIDEEVTLTGPSTVPGAGQNASFLSGPDRSDICAIGVCATTDFSDPAEYAVPATSQTTFQRTDDYWAPAASLVWSTTDSGSIYLSFSQGRTPGGLAATPLRGVELGIDPDHNGSPNEIEFNSEKITSFEFGASASTPNDTLHFNAAIFFQQIDDRQVVTDILSVDFGDDPVDPADDENILIDSIAGQADVDVTGIELGIRWQPNDHWNIAAEYTYLDSEYDSFSVLSTNAAEIAAAGSCAVTTLGGLATCGIDLAGNEVAGVPDNAFVGAISYTAPLADTGIDWFIATNGRYQDKRFINASNTASVSDYWISDLRLGVTTDRWDVVFYVDNVFDNDTVQWAAQQADTANAEIRLGANIFGFTTTMVNDNYPQATIANLPDPQRWGVRAGFRF